MPLTARKAGGAISSGGEEAPQAALSEEAAGQSQAAAAGNEETTTKEPQSAEAWDTPPLNFPARLMQILQMEDPPEGIYWLPDGKRFAVSTEKIEDVLVTYFQGAKWLSFTRTLNKW